eukprot:COSAG06_NODE_36799_length_442_cov_2.877551_2_plen_71_part_00
MTGVRGSENIGEGKADNECSRSTEQDTTGFIYHRGCIYFIIFFPSSDNLKPPLFFKNHFVFSAAVSADGV